MSLNTMRDLLFVTYLEYQRKKIKVREKNSMLTPSSLKTRVLLCEHYFAMKTFFKFFIQIIKFASYLSIVAFSQKFHY